MYGFARRKIRAFANSCSKVVNLLSRGESTQSVVCARLLTLLELHFGSSVWDATSMRDVLQWVTEGGDHCSQLVKMSGKEVRERFGMSLLLLPWHARMWGMVQKTHIPRLLKADESKLLNVAAASHAMHSHLPQPHEWVPTACVSTKTKSTVVCDVQVYSSTVLACDVQWAQAGGGIRTLALR